eukprot:scaffold10239_cov122-Isochrysis_galbana.AAC.4
MGVCVPALNPDCRPSERDSLQPILTPVALRRAFLPTSEWESCRSGLCAMLLASLPLACHCVGEVWAGLGSRARASVDSTLVHAHTKEKTGRNQKKRTRTKRPTPTSPPLAATRPPTSATARRRGARNQRQTGVATR